MIFLSSNSYDLPLIEVFGAEEIDGLFKAIYAIAYPIMPILMIGLALSVVTLLIVTVRRVFGFGVMTGRRDDDE